VCGALVFNKRFDWWRLEADCFLFDKWGRGIKERRDDDK
jgi:hypothetical protein